MARCRRSNGAPRREDGSGSQRSTTARRRDPVSSASLRSRSGRAEADALQLRRRREDALGVHDRLTRPSSRGLGDRGLPAARGALAHRRDPGLPGGERPDDPERGRGRLRPPRPLRAGFDGAELTGPKYSRVGSLVIPVHSDLERRTGRGGSSTVSSGSPRSARPDIESFPICVVAFITDDDQEQREQFILVNSTKPLPKGLIYELLPSTTGEAPLAPTRTAVSRPPPRPAEPRRRVAAPRADPHADRRHRPHQGQLGPQDAREQPERRCAVSLPRRRREYAGGHRLHAPRAPRLLAGDLSGLPRRLGHLAAPLPAHARGRHREHRLRDGRDRGPLPQVGIPDVEQFRKDLEPLRDVCRWTDGYWDFGPGIQRKWNEIQNTPRDIQILANYLLVQYKSRVWNRATDTGRTK